MQCVTQCVTHVDLCNALHTQVHTVGVCITCVIPDHLCYTHGGCVIASCVITCVMHYTQAVYLSKDSYPARYDQGRTQSLLRGATCALPEGSIVANRAIQRV